MGSYPWWCRTPYKEPLQDTLVELRHRQFLQNVARDPDSYDSAEKIEEGIAEYIEVCDADGTCSILDVETITTKPQEFDYGSACPLSDETLKELFDTDKPTAPMLDDDEGGADEVFDLLDRGQACYVIAYENDKPVELYFFGMSYD